MVCTYCTGCGRTIKTHTGRCVWLRCTCQVGWQACLCSFKWTPYRYLHVPLMRQKHFPCLYDLPLKKMCEHTHAVHTHAQQYLTESVFARNLYIFIYPVIAAYLYSIPTTQHQYRVWRTFFGYAALFLFFSFFFAFGNLSSFHWIFFIFLHLSNSLRTRKRALSPYFDTSTFTGVSRKWCQTRK